MEHLLADFILEFPGVTLPRKHYFEVEGCRALLRLK